MILLLELGLVFFHLLAWVAVCMPPHAGLVVLGELLVAQGLVQSAEVARALAFQQQAGGRLGGVLVRMGRMRLRA